MDKYKQIGIHIFIFTRIRIRIRIVLNVPDIDIHPIRISYIPLEYSETDTV